MRTQEEALELIMAKVKRLDARLIGRRPHSNDIQWAKQLAADIYTIAAAALSKKGS